MKIHKSGQRHGSKVWAHVLPVRGLDLILSFSWSSEHHEECFPSNKVEVVNGDCCYGPKFLKDNHNIVKFKPRIHFEFILK